MAALRLTFDIFAGQPKLRSARKLKIPVPPQQRIANMGNGAGIWIETRDVSGNPLYRRVIDAQTFEADTEIRTGTSDRPIARKTSKRVQSVLVVAVPDQPEAASFHILEIPPGKKSRKPIMRLSLKFDDDLPIDDYEQRGVK